MNKSQSPQLKEFELTIKCGTKTTTRTLVSTSKEAAIKQGNNILKYVPGPPAKVIDAKEKT